VEDATGEAVTEAALIGVGSSRRTWGVDVAGGRALVVREDTGTGPVAGTPLTLHREAAVYGALTGRGLPVPALVAVAPDGTALLLERARGEADLRSAPATDRPAVVADYLRQLGRLHLLEPADLDLGPLSVPADGRAHALDDVRLWHDIHAAIPAPWASAAAAYGLEWLGRNPPAAATRTSLCHGDAGPLNFLFEGDRVTALLDWEFAHVGDPVDDLAWVAVRNQVLRTGVDLPSAFAVWRDTTGCDVDPARLEYYRALVLVRMLVSCDGAVRWTQGEETDDNRTQVLLRPYLALTICQALRRAGCDEPELRPLEAQAAHAWTASPLVRAFGTDPVLDELGALL
jgi:aminoglycoside phosphotransferase (APT) family kinase protein